MDFKSRLNQGKQLVEDLLIEMLPKTAVYQKSVIDSMEYSLKAGGKRLRPILLIEACRALGGDVKKAYPFACAVEMIHTYSLIHDDLPAMDDDDLRRGKPTNHKVFGEGIAILAGDGLLNYAHELMIKSIVEDVENKSLPRAAYEISNAAGVYGMIGGQCADLEGEGKPVDLKTLEFIHRHKTGALITAPLKAGAIIGGATKAQLESIEKYGEAIGLAFQITDDILDVVGDEKSLGKKVGSDEANEKSTYPSIYGLEESRKMAREQLEKALKQLEAFNDEADFFRELAKHIVERDN